MYGTTAMQDSLLVVKQTSKHLTKETTKAIHWQSANYQFKNDDMNNYTVLSTLIFSNTV